MIAGFQCDACGRPLQAILEDAPPGQGLYVRDVETGRDVGVSCPGCGEAVQGLAIAAQCTARRVSPAVLGAGAGEARHA